MAVGHIGLGASPVGVSLQNSFTNPIIVCTHKLGSITENAVAPRLSAITNNSFEVRLQTFTAPTTVTPTNVNCLIAEEGSYNTGGLKYEARSVLSNLTAGKNQPNGWLPNAENVTNDLSQTYSNPVVFGQVMTMNDTDNSVFWNSDCADYKNPPFTTATICIGKHTGLETTSVGPETLGYIVAEAVDITVNQVAFEIARSPKIVAGAGDAPPYNVAVNTVYDSAILNQNGMAGGDGSWAVLWGNNPYGGSNLDMAVDETSTNRFHTTEHIGFWAVKDNQTPNIQAVKTVMISPLSANSHTLPGSDLIYTLQVNNLGALPIDPDSLIIIDKIPPQTMVYYGDIDGPGPKTEAVQI